MKETLRVIASFCYDMAVEETLRVIASFCYDMAVKEILRIIDSFSHDKILHDVTPIRHAPDFKSQKSDQQGEEYP